MATTEMELFYTQILIFFFPFQPSGLDHRRRKDMEGMRFTHSGLFLNLLVDMFGGHRQVARLK